MSSQPAIPRWLHSVSRATMGSLRTQTSSHTWLCSQLLPYFLQLSAPAGAPTSQQRLWKWEIGQQVTVTQHCVPSSLLLLSAEAPLSVPAAFPAQLMTAARWTGGGCGHSKSARHRQQEWKQTPGRFPAFPHGPPCTGAVLSPKLFRPVQLQPLWGTGQLKSFAYQIPCTDAKPGTDWSNLGTKSIKCKWKWNNSSPLTKCRSLNSYKSHPSSNTFPAFPKHSNSINCLYFRGKCIQ